MPRAKTKLIIVYADQNSDDETADICELVYMKVAEANTQAEAENWLKEHGEDGTVYQFMRSVRTVTKTVKKTVVLVDG